MELRGSAVESYEPERCDRTNVFGVVSRVRAESDERGMGVGSYHCWGTVSVAGGSGIRCATSAVQFRAVQCVERDGSIMPLNVELDPHICSHHPHIERRSQPIPAINECL